MKPKETIKCLCHAAKAAAMRRHVPAADLIMDQAVLLTFHKYKNGQLFPQALSFFASHLFDSDDVEGACRVAQKGVELYRDLLGEVNARVAMAHSDLAYFLYVRDRAKGDLTPALDNVSASLRILEKIYPSGNFCMQQSLRYEALILEEIGFGFTPREVKDQQKLEEAESLHRQALELCEKHQTTESYSAAANYFNLSRFCTRLRRLPEAKQSGERAEEILKKIGMNNDLLMARCLFQLGMVREEEKNYNEAKSYYSRSMDMKMLLRGESYTGLQVNYLGLVRVNQALGMAQNVQTCKEQLSKLEKSIRERQNGRQLASIGDKGAKLGNLRDTFEVLKDATKRLKQSDAVSAKLAA
jgi:tetratricopeptide (TPR) repeat protein